MDMEDILKRENIKIEDVIQFILQADAIDCDASRGSDISIPIYDISPEEFLDFAGSAMKAGTKEGIVNAVSNLKRALDCEMDMFFESINMKRILDKNNLGFEKKTRFLADIGMFPIQSINKLNWMRNKMEHEYKTPEIADLNAYYEIVWSAVKIIDLYLELLYINGAIWFVLHHGDREYYLTMEHDVEECGFIFEIADLTEDKERKKRLVNIKLGSKSEIRNYTIAFNLYLFSIQYFDYGNGNLYRNKLRKLMASESL